MAYLIDIRKLPEQFKDPQTSAQAIAAYKAKVNDVISKLGIGKAAQPDLRNGIIGMMLADGYYDITAGNFPEQVRRLWNYIQLDVLDSNGRPVPDKANPGTNLTNRDTFIAVDAEIKSIRGAAADIYFQEFATAARSIIDGNRGDIVQDPVLLNSAVAASLQDYGSGLDTQGSFDLPPLSDSTTGGGIDEIIPDHIRGVGVLYAALQLEILGLFKVVDRNVEIFMNGQLPVANDLGGNALNAYYWNTVNRMSETARWMQYSRVLGAPGGEVSKEVAPNTVFDETFVRFLSALSEYDRQQRVDDLLKNGRGLTLNAEHIRKAGRDLAANCTLYGYGYTQFAAKRLQLHIQAALNLLKLPDIQQAWGVQNAWQVIERVSSQEFHTTPNVVKYRTMAESGKKILDLVAAYPSAWTSTSDKPLFADPQNEVSALLVAVTMQVNPALAPAHALAAPGGAAAPQGITPDIDADGKAQFMRHTEYWLAVNGIKDQAVADSAQPADTASTPSIPSMDGSNGSSPDLAGQIQQMLQQGQTPSPDQLRKMVGI